ncbi:OsmC family protein [Microbacterium oxydans]|uniref:OsmC family protein n=1 Tax=Microbacterium oxydans TaxID=82380 RepID=UPI00362C7D66
MSRSHHYEILVEWVGNLGSGTSSYRAFSRDHVVTAATTPPILASSDVAFRGDPGRWNPEQLFLSAIAQCHMLWFLHLASQAGVIVLSYVDAPSGEMIEQDDGRGRFETIVLRPLVTITAESDPAFAQSLHSTVADYCYIARSVSVPIVHHPVTVVDGSRVPAP